MWGNFRALTTTFLRSPEHFTQFKRTTFILKRKHNNVKLNKLGAVHPKKLRKRNFYYELVEDTNYKKKPPIEVVLAENVAGVGMKGEKVEMNIYLAYRDLLLPKLAFYADSPEAQSILSSTKEKHYSSIYSKIVENFLATQAVEITMSNDVPWTLQQWHVKLALRKYGILTSEECITIPKEISGPKFEIENKDFLIYLTLNQSEKFSLRCRIHLWSSLDPLLNQKSFDMNSPSEALFPDEKEVIDSLIKTAEEIRRKEMLKGHFQHQHVDKTNSKK